LKNLKLKSLGSFLVSIAVIVQFSVVSAFGQATSRLEDMQLDNDSPIQIESDRLDIAEKSGTATFEGNVNVVQGDTILKTGKLIVYYEGSGGAATGASAIERLEASQKVLIQSKSQKASGDQATFNMKTEVLTLTGKEVVLTEGENIAVGCSLRINMKNGRAKLEGCNNGGQKKRPTIILNPKSNKN